MLRNLAVVVVALGSVSVAQADLITLRIDVELRDCEPLTVCFDYFEQDTGLTLPYNSPTGEPVPVTAWVTVDSTTEDLKPDRDDLNWYESTSHGSGIAVTIGELTFFNAGVGMYFSGGDWLSIFSLTGRAGFPIAPGSGLPYPAPTLNEFLSSDLSDYGAIGVTPVVRSPPNSDGKFWQLFTSGDSLTITRVPEPGTLALLGIGLFGMGLARRNKKV